MDRGAFTFTAYMGLKHGWQLFNLKPSDNGPIMYLLNRLNLNQGVIKAFAILTMLCAVLILIPQTFVLEIY